MFNAYDFTYAGISASDFGLHVCDVGSKSHSDNAFGNQAKIVETRLGRRVTPLHYGVQWNDSPLTFSLIFASDEIMDRYQMQEVALWLTGHQQYQWLTLDQPDLRHVRFKCLIQKLTPITVGWAPIAFEADVICDCPYGYSETFEETYTIDGETTISFVNLSTCREMLRPELEITKDVGTTSFKIENVTTGAKEFLLDGLPGVLPTIYVDNENCIMKTETASYDLYQYFNFGFLEFAAGVNKLTVTGNGTLTIRGRYLYNVGA